MRIALRRWMIAVLLLLAAPPTALAQTQDDFFNPNILHEIRIVIKPIDWQTLKANFLSNDYYECNFLWRYQGKDVVSENIGIRSRGTGSRSPIKPGLRVDFNRYDDAQTFLGLKSVILRNNTQDASMMHERLSMIMFQQLGLPASREAHTRLYVNNEYVGLYTIVESVDKSFLKRNFNENDGYLFEYKWVYPYYFTYLGTDLSRYAELFNPHTHEHESDTALYAPIEAFIRTLDQSYKSSDADFTRAMADFVDLKLLLTHVAVERFVTEQDGIVGVDGTNNFYFYRFEKKNLSQFLAWDKSEAFKGVLTEPIWHFIDDVPAEKQVRLVNRALQVPELRSVYLGALAKCALAAGGAGGFLEQEIEREYNQIRAAALADPNKQCPDAGGNPAPCSNQRFEDDVEYLRQFARQRGDFVLSQVAASLPPPRRRP